MEKRSPLAVVRFARVMVAGVIVTGAIMAGCVPHGATELRPLSTSLAKYDTCTIHYEGQVSAEGAPFVAYLEDKLRSHGVFEPVGAAGDLQVHVRSVGGKGVRAEVQLVVDLEDARQRESIGRISIREAAEGSGFGARQQALHRAADGIVDYLEKGRGVRRRVTTTTSAPADGR